jgi:hypothetical protein
MSAVKTAHPETHTYLTHQTAMAVEWCVDAVCFSGTHLIQDDGAVLPKETIPKLKQLKADQEARIHQLYGPQAMTPDALAEQLEELYRADADSLAERDPGEPSVVDNLTDFTARVFKKEMKQRIHDWEGAFRDKYGREATAVDKMRLRAIYELYKAVKTRVVDGTVPGSTTASVNSAAGSATERSARPGQASSTPGRASGGSEPTGSALRQSTPGMHQRLGVGMGVSPATGARPSTSTPVTPATGSRAQHHDPIAAPSRPAPNPPPPVVEATAAPQPGAPAGDSQLAAAISEKRALKRQLHAFEEEFRARHGRQPTKEDRKPLHKEYHRYGELKAVLTQAGSTD